MPNELQYDQPKEKSSQKDEREKLHDRIREQVIHALGTPGNLRNVQIRTISDNQYRVNVIVGDNAGAVRIANSFFIVIDSKGEITTSPRITKQY